MPRNGKVCKFLSCSSNSKRHPTKKFYPFAKPWMNLEKCLRWISASGKKDLTPVFIDKNSYVCEDHFVNGVPSAENPDPLPYDILTCVVYSSAQHIVENPNVHEDHVKASSVDDFPEVHADENSGVHEGSVVNESPATGKSDVLQNDFQACSTDAPKQAKSLLNFCYPDDTISSKKQAALPVKKKSPCPKKTLRLNQAPYRVVSSRPKVTNVNKDIRGILPHRIPRPLIGDVSGDILPTGDCLSQTENVSSSVSPADDVTSPVTPTDNVRNLHRRLFDDFMIDVFGNESNGNEKTSPLLGRSFQSTSTDSRKMSGVIEKDGKCSVESQTWSRAYVNKLIAAGKLSSLKATSLERQTTTVESHDDNGEKRVKRSRVITVNSGGRITIVEPHADDDNEGSGCLSKAGSSRSKGNEPPRMRSTSSEGRIPIVDTDNKVSDDEDSEAEASEAEEAEHRSGTEELTHRKCLLSFEVITSDNDFEYLCGMSRQNFEVLYSYLGGDDVCSRLKYESVSGTSRQLRVRRLSIKCRLFMTLCHLRRGFSEMELAIFFGCNVSLVSRILYTWINFIYLEFKPLEEQMFQDRRSQSNDRSMPEKFKTFNGRRVIIDCTEIKVETLSAFKEIDNSWSSYKHTNTVKYLIGINCHGAIMYVSKAFEGSLSDKEVFMCSTMYDMLRPGDVIMADRGFDISRELDKIKVKLIIPSYLEGMDYLSPKEDIWSKKIVKARNLLENAIGRLRMWKILNETFPQSTLPFVSQMVFVCACLTNFHPALL